MAGRNQCDELRAFHSVTLAEQLATQFYEWEQRGRGWLLWDEPVRIEPPFQPFPGYRLPATESGDDDGRRQTWLSGFVQWASRALIGKRKPPTSPEPEEAEGIDAILLSDSAIPVELQVTLPPDATMGDDAIGRFLLSLGSCRSPLSFELIGLADETVIQFACGPSDLNYVRGQLQAHFPDAVVKPPKQSFTNRWENLAHSKVAVIEFGLSREFVLPLFAPEGDLLIGLAGAMEELDEGELAMLQVLFEPIRHPWSASILRAVATADGDSMFDGPVDMLDQAKTKIALPLFAAVIPEFVSG
jgi:hypothetical protein